MKVSPLGPEANSPNGMNSLIGHDHLNNNQLDERGVCHSLPVFIPVGKPRLSDISDQDTRAAIDLSQQPQYAPVITAAVVADTVQDDNKGP